MNPKKLGGFDVIAPLYDWLARLVFRDSIRSAQLCFLREIREGGRVLILGGGTGWLLSELLNTNPNCEVWYIDASRKMLEKSRKKIANQPTTCVHFIHGTEAFLLKNIQYDAVIANFYFDMFSSFSLESTINQIRKSIMPMGILLVSDFITNRIWWQRTLCFLMYKFFRSVCGIQATHLPDWQHHLTKLGLEEIESRHFYGEFIKSSVYGIRVS